MGFIAVIYGLASYAIFFWIISLRNRIRRRLHRSEDNRFWPQCRHA